MDLLIVEVGGTVGDIESLPFLEAIRQFRADVGRENVLYMHIALVPYIATAGELKTKPVQHSVKELRAVGISPDVIVCRTDRFLPRAIKQKVALFCNVDDDAVITAKDVESIYELPLILHDEGLDEKVTKLLNIWTGRPNLEKWQRLVEAVKNPERTVRIAMVGKYVDLTESYKSLNEALYHAGFAHRARVVIEYIDSEKLTDPAPIADVDGILVPHGFGCARRRRQDRRDPLRARAQGPVLRHLLRHAAGGDRVRAPRRGPGRRQLDRDRPRDAVPGDRSDARAARAFREGRDDATRRVSVRAASGHPGVRAPTAPRRSPSATAIATR